MMNCIFGPPEYYNQLLLNLPDGYKTIGFPHWSLERQCWQLVIEHESFDEVPDFQTLPQILERYRTVKVARYPIDTDVYSTSDCLLRPTNDPKRPGQTTVSGATKDRQVDNAPKGDKLTIEIRGIDPKYADAVKADLLKGLRARTIPSDKVPDLYVAKDPIVKVKIDNLHKINDGHSQTTTNRKVEDEAWDKACYQQAQDECLEILEANIAEGRHLSGLYVPGESGGVKIAEIIFDKPVVVNNGETFRMKYGLAGTYTVEHYDSTGKLISTTKTVNNIIQDFNQD